MGAVAEGGETYLNEELMAEIGVSDDDVAGVVARKTAEGHTKPEIIRSLKRYLAREIYYLLNPATPSRTTHPTKINIAA